MAFTNEKLQWILRRNVLILFDMLLLSIILTLYLAIVNVFLGQPFDLNMEGSQVQWYVIVAVIWVFYSYVFNLYRQNDAHRTREIIKRTFIVALLTGVTYIFIPFITPVFPSSRGPALSFLFTIVGFMIIWRILFAKFFNHPIMPKRSIILGAGWTGRELVRALQGGPSAKGHQVYKVFGFVDDNSDKHGKSYDGFPVFGAVDQIVDLAKEHKLHEVILAIPSNNRDMSGLLYKHIMDLKRMGIDVVSYEDVYESSMHKIMVRELDKGYRLSYPMVAEANNRLYYVLNRLINIFFASIGLLGFGLILPFIYLCNIFLNRGPMFYTQVRVGRHGKDFVIYKLRSMVTDAEKHGPKMSHAGDARITPFGHLLRKTRLDEMPQFWNILKGDMNLIGPRPERPVFVEQLNERIEFYDLRHNVKPGLTGWAQVSYKYGSTAEDSLIKLQYDLYYIKHRSFLLDLRIVFKTISVMARFMGT